MKKAVMLLLGVLLLAGCGPTPHEELKSKADALASAKEDYLKEINKRYQTCSTTRGHEFSDWVVDDEKQAENELYEPYGPITQYSHHTCKFCGFVETEVREIEP